MNRSLLQPLWSLFLPLCRMQCRNKLTREIISSWNVPWFDSKLSTALNLSNPTSAPQRHPNVSTSTTLPSAICKAYPTPSGEGLPQDWPAQLAYHGRTYYEGPEWGTKIDRIYMNRRIHCVSSRSNHHLHSKYRHHRYLIRLIKYTAWSITMGLTVKVNHFLVNKPIDMLVCIADKGITCDNFSQIPSKDCHYPHTL